MYHVIQENCFREANYNNLIEAVKRLELDYEIVKVFPFLEDFDYKTDRKDVMVWGGTKIARLAAKLNWQPGSFLNDNHDFLVYKSEYGEELFNYNSRIIEFQEDIEWPDAFFARPTSDGKAFTGKVFNKEDWIWFRDRTIDEEYTDPSEKIQICGIKKIFKEARFWVVKGKIISGSIYKTGFRVYSDPLVDPDAYEYAQRMVDKFQLADAFVIDLCLGEDGWKILELGCINSAGFYAADMQKIVMALELAF